MGDKKADAIDEILRVRDQLVVMRERLFHLTAATAARTKKVDGLLMDCAAAGRVFGARIGLPEWDNVLAMPGHEFIPSLEYELKHEMERVTKNFLWKSPEQLFDRSTNDFRLLLDILAGLDEWVRSRPAPRRTLRQIVLERLDAAAPKGSKAAAIRAYAKDNLQRDFSVKAVGMTLNRLAKEGRARRDGHVWFPVQQGLEMEDDGAITF